MTSRRRKTEKEVVDTILEADEIQSPLVVIKMNRTVWEYSLSMAGRRVMQGF